MRRLARLGLLALLVPVVGAVGACRLPRESRTPRHWMLTPIEAAGASVEMTFAVGVGPVEFPEYLDRHGVVRRTSSNELHVAEFELWAQSLRQDFIQVLGRNLEILVPGVVAVPFPWKGPRQDLAYRVVVVVHRFDAGPEDQVVLDAAWALHRGTSTAWVAGGRRSLQVPVQGEGYPAIVAAMSEAVAALSREIAPHVALAR